MAPGSGRLYVVLNVTMPEEITPITHEEGQGRIRPPSSSSRPDPATLGVGGLTPPLALAGTMNKPLDSVVHDHNTHAL
jgi:hypothetical protein